MPPAAEAATVPPAAEAAPVPPAAAPTPTVAPSAYRSGGPSVAIATYDPRTGQFATPDGAVARQTDVVAPGGPKAWTDLLPTS